MTWRQWISAATLLTALGACSSGSGEVRVAEEPSTPSSGPTDETAADESETEPATGPAADEQTEPAEQLVAGAAAPLPGLAILCVDATISGGASFDGSFVSGLPTATCAEYVAGDQFLPGTLSIILVPSDDTPASFDLFLPAYDGPGTYSGDQVDPGLSVFAPPPPGAAAEGVLYSLAPAASVSVTVNGDGSGSAEISELVDNLTGAAPISASATWICVDPA